MDFKDYLIEEAKAKNIHISLLQAEKFEIYKDLLLEWNEKVNLTAIVDEREIITKHFIDSISLIKYMDIKNKKAIDIGTGAGFPGIPLKIMEESLDMTLLDSLNKRINFLDIVIEKLELKNIKAIHLRAEDGSKEKRFREKFDISLARAVANMSMLSELAIPYVKIGGCFIAYKGEEIDKELKEAKKGIKILNGEIEKVENIILEGEINHTLVFIKKINKTDIKYPRNFGNIKSKPL